MTKEEMSKLFEEARGQTSAKGAELTFLAAQDSDWILLVKSPGSDELAIQIEGGGEKSAEEVRREIREQLMRLF